MIYDFNVNISADRLLAMYRGNALYLVVRSRQGLTLQLPLANFRPYVGPDGLQGHFKVKVDGKNRIQVLERLD